jgi:hypothetical protein
MYISFTLSVSPSLQVVSLCRLFLFFPFCIKEEYKTNDSSTNHVADQHYSVKQNVHKFSTSPFYFQRLVNPFYFDSFHYTFLFFVGVLFLEIISTSLYVTLNFWKSRLFLSIKRRSIRITFFSLTLVLFIRFKATWTE